VDPVRTDGRVTGVVGVAQDATVEIEVEEQSQRARKMDALARLAGRVAHDFNNSLTAILGYCDLLTGEFPAGDARAADLKAIETAALRAAATADRLTAFSPHRANEARPVDLNALVQSYDATLGELLGPKISRVYRLEPSLPLMRVDPAQMREMLRQLASNAKEAMGEGGGQLVVATQRRDAAGAGGAASREGSWARISVHDTGPGLSEEARTHLFEPYFSTRSREKDKGLGLATTYGLVKQNGGEITFHSVPGKGASFHLDFPLWSGIAATPTAQTAQGGESPRGTETILLAEDEAAVRTAVQRVLQNLGYTVLAAADGKEALTLLEGESGAGVTLLLSDIVMPGMDGVELARQVSARRPDVRRLLMSGYAERSLTADGRLPAGTAFFQKPFAYPALARRIREVLDASPSSDLLK
jgi:nitrogen-specific signal transduction histidine kinase